MTLNCYINDPTIWTIYIVIVEQDGGQCSSDERGSRHFVVLIVFWTFFIA